MITTPQLEAEVVCLTCKLFFTIHDIGKNLGDGDGSGFHISGMGCPNCERKTLDFDLISVTPKPECSANDIVNYRLEHRGIKPIQKFDIDKKSRENALKLEEIFEFNPMKKEWKKKRKKKK